LAIIANQPAKRTAELRTLGAIVDVIAMSEELGLHKPDPRFFNRSLELMGSPNPDDVAYIGDRLDNDVGPADAAGMRTVWIRRGPWGLIQAASPPSRTIVVDSLTELVDRLDEVWAVPVPG
jgi:FMN phosphatase YigB (HAD superfamily)